MENRVTHDNTLTGLLLGGIFLMLMAVGTLCAQPIDREMYAKVVGMNTKRNCPYYEEGWVVNKLRYTPGYLHFDITLQENFIPGNDSAQLRQYLADRIRYRMEPDEFNYLLQKLGDINGGFVYDIVTDSSQTKLTLKYPPAEARQIWADRSKPAYKDNKRWKARNRLSREVRIVNASLPRMIDEFTRADFAEITQDTLLYQYTFFEKEYLKKEQLIATLPQIRNQIKSNLQLQPDYLELLVDSRINLTYRYLDTDRVLFTEILLPYFELMDLLKTSGKLKPATDEQIDHFIREQIIEKEAVAISNDPDDSLRLTSVDYANRTIQYTYTVIPEYYQDGMTPETVELVRKSTAAHLNRIFNIMMGNSTVYDGGIITLDRFYQHIKGVQMLYMEEGTRRTTDIFISTKDILNSPTFDSIPMNSTVEYFHRKMLYEEFRREMDEFIADSLPMAVDYGTLDSIIFVRDTLHFHYTVTPDKVGLFNDYNLTKKDYRDLIWYTDMEEFFETLVELDANSAQHWHLPNDSLCSITYSTAEIRQAIEMPEEEVRLEMRKMLLDEVIPAVNMECPFQEDDFTFLDSVGIQNGMYTHYYKVVGAPIEAINQVDLRWHLQSALMSINDEEGLALLNMIVKAGYGVCYHFGQPTTEQKKSKKTPTPVTIQICFTKEELTSFLEE
ncbi:MAG: hypothetical protein IKZ54_09650 [Bacteroidales bacterium]|nr:hypothetical protein [Bacteroidales bacterium]